MCFPPGLCFIQRPVSRILSFLMAKRQVKMVSSFFSRSIVALGTDLSDFFYMRPVFTTVGARLKLPFPSDCTSKTENDYEKTERLEGKLGGKTKHAYCCMFCLCHLQLSPSHGVHMGIFFFSLSCCSVLYSQSA